MFYYMFINDHETFIGPHFGEIHSQNLSKYKF
jgi:hypothetical protein